MVGIGLGGDIQYEGDVDLYFGEKERVLHCTVLYCAVPYMLTD